MAKFVDLGVNQLQQELNTTECLVHFTCVSDAPVESVAFSSTAIAELQRQLDQQLDASL